MERASRRGFETPEKTCARCRRRCQPREARRKPSWGKSDPSDALAIARVVAREDELPVAGRSEALEDLKLLADHRDQLVRACTQAQNRIHKHLVVMSPGYEARVVNVAAKKHLDALQARLRNDSSTRAGLVCRHIADVKRLSDDIYQVTKEIEEAGRARNLADLAHGCWPRKPQPGSSAMWAMSDAFDPRPRSRR
jgi:hypothetical protein